MFKSLKGLSFTSCVQFDHIDQNISLNTLCVNEDSTLSNSEESHSNDRSENDNHIRKTKSTSRIDEAILQYNLGCALQKRGMLHEAILCYQESIHLDPTNIEPYYNLGNTFQEINDVEQAEKYYTLTLHRMPNHYLAQFNMGCLLQEQDKTESSLIYFQKASKINPYDIEVYINLGNSYRTLKKYQDAENEYLAAIRLDSKSSQAHYFLGLTYLDLHKLDKAIQMFQSALDCDAEYIDAHYSLAVSYLDRALTQLESKEQDLRKSLHHYDILGKQTTCEDDFSKGAEYVRSLLARRLSVHLSKHFRFCVGKNSKP
eukprot:gene13079-27605_t